MTPEDHESADWRRQHPELAELPSGTVFQTPSADDPTPESTLHDLAPNTDNRWLSPYRLWTKTPRQIGLLGWQPQTTPMQRLRRLVTVIVLIVLIGGVLAGAVTVAHG